ncbi:efflux RND transporter periplasmic adaptor subunit [Clostridium sp. B9]|uniref:efflux RND transporter periplasmic adaptor subunit n=1 Tax=Clostridium sp. B9 TaxID=3423224 RepID=UPI003D2F363E
MKKKYIIAIVTVVILAGVGVGSYYLKKNMSKETTASIELYTVPATDKVFVNGEIKPEDVETIYLEPTKGQVDKVDVKNGDTVEKGAPLFTYKNDQAEAQIEQLQLQLTSAKNQREDLLKQKEEMKKQAEEAKKKAEEAQKQLEIMQKAGDNSQQQPMVQTQIPNLGANIGGGEISTDSIDEQISLLEKQIKSLKDKEYYTVNAPISGKVIMSDSKGNPTAPYMTIESTDYYVNGSVNEKDQPRIKDGQEVEITILSTNKNIKGKITSVGNTPVDSGASLAAAQAGGQGGGSSMSYYNVTITPDTQEDLTNGFHVQASVNLEQKPLVIPKSAILKADNEEYVFKDIDGKLTKQVITYAPKEGSNDEVIVKSGLKESDEIVTNPTYDMKEGMPVE